MKPVNSKSLFHFICDQMEKLNEGIIKVQDAQAQANLAKQANNILTYELKRAQVQIELDKHNIEFLKNIGIRDIETKLFDENK